MPETQRAQTPPPNEIKRASLWGRAWKRYGIDALSAMALGLFSSLIIGLILQQIGRIPGLSMIADFAKTAQSAPVVGAAIGVAVAWSMKVPPLAMFSNAAVGAVGYALGQPLGCFISSVVGAELGRLVAGRTKVDIIVVPSVTILAGGLTAMATAPAVLSVINALRGFIDTAMLLQPIPMGIILSVVVGLVLTAPISSAALCAMVFAVAEGESLTIGLQLAAGAATVGCCAQMIGFAVSSYRDNGVSGLIAQGLGTSMLQVPNILRRPAILIPPTLAAAILGPLAATIFDMRNAGAAAGMGTSGLVGQIGTWSAMIGESAPWPLLLKIIALHFILPAALSLAFSEGLRKIGWIRPGDQKLTVR
ncbi:MAG: PTS sugar transporter subunit IIC [Oscillospiraceae bacterium]|nr:PTS sugar transporter subunit IIC [Oscillospiraceae bacterium]